MHLYLTTRALFRLLLSPVIMIEKAYSVFLCFLLISVLFFPLTTAGRVLLDTPQNVGGSGNYGNDGSKIPVHPSKSSSAPSATGHSSPSHATPSRNSAASSKTTSTAATVNPNRPYQCGSVYRDCSHPRAGKK